MTSALRKTPGARGATTATSIAHESARARGSHGGGSQAQACGTGWSPRADSVVTVRAPSSNRKLAPIDMVANASPRLRPTPRPPYAAATYAPIEQTCSARCRFKGSGCMAESGFTGGAVHRLERLAGDLDAVELARREAHEIDRTWRNGVPQLGGRDGNAGIDLRLHVSGDSRTVRGTYALAGAALRWRERGGGSVWTFTHSWREVPRAAWGDVSVLASIERLADVERARARGYAPALVVDRFPHDEKCFDAGGVKFIPCPAETKAERTCVECRLCLDRTEWMLETGRGIAFAVHGPGASSAKRHLEVVA